MTKLCEVPVVLHCFMLIGEHIAGYVLLIGEHIHSYLMFVGDHTQPFNISW